MKKFDGLYSVTAYLEYGGLSKRRYFSTKTATIRYVNTILGDYERIQISKIKKSEIENLKSEKK